MPMNRSHPALCSLLLTLSGLAWADDEPNPYYLGVSQAVTADTNVRRAAEGQPTGKDLISTTAVSAGLDQPLGRGRLAADLSFNASRYKNNSEFNHNGHNARARLDWESLYRTSGDISLYDGQRLYRNDVGGTPDPSGVSERDLLRTSGINTSMRIGLVTLWTLEGGLSYDRARHSSAQLEANDLTQRSANLGVRLRPSSLWSVRLGARKTEGDYPNYTPDPANPDRHDELERDDIDLSTTWTPNGTSQLDTRISSTHQTHTLLTPRDARFVTGLLGYNWSPTGKTRLRLQFSRDTSVGGTDEEFKPIPSLTSSSTNTGLNNSLLLRSTWNATAKITADASYTYSRRSLEGSSSLAGVLLSSSNSRDRSHTVGLGVTYQASRAIGLGCSITHDQRRIETTDTVAATNTSTEREDRYRFSTGSCYARFHLQ